MRKTRTKTKEMKKVWLNSGKAQHVFYRREIKKQWTTNLHKCRFICGNETERKSKREKS